MAFLLSYDVNPSTLYSPITGARSTFWPGFVVGFLLLSLITCGGLATLSGVGNLHITDFQQNGMAWTPPPVTPTLNISETTTTGSGDPEHADVASFLTGDRVRNVTSSPVNIRREPGYLGKAADDIVAQAFPGDTVDIVEGPSMADNLTWWRIRYTTAAGISIDGWIAEATASGVQILDK